MVRGLCASRDRALFVLDQPLSLLPQGIEGFSDKSRMSLLIKLESVQVETIGE
jgi:hypothetical protein